ncbi:hypothetical protein N657DRAFT_650119 [Parathielavia appendiculata]|uniref:Uncharacterized protein n=1 Tax=Parathielavia appendiculata TaxID=2587402 RepID=A0AAN6YZ42_9PEZI|nr:hypothetical protein N657DRAFT_650119 [Parathielavia appendiculata]
MPGDVRTVLRDSEIPQPLHIPHKGPDSEDGKSGIYVSRREVKVFPTLGMRERFVRALLPELADPDCILFWDPLVESSASLVKVSLIVRGRRPNCTGSAQTPGIPPHLWQAEARPKKKSRAKRSV